MAAVRGHQEDQVQAVQDHQEVQAVLVAQAAQVAQAVQEVQVQQGHDEILYLYINIFIIYFRMLYNDKSPGS